MSFKTSYQAAFISRGLLDYRPGAAKASARPPRCSCCLAVVVGYRVTKTNITELDAVGLSRRDIICEDCSSWHWMTHNESFEQHFMLGVATMDGYWEQWFVGLPDIHNDNPIGMDSPWFREFSASGGDFQRAYLCGEEAFHPF